MNFIFYKNNRSNKPFEVSIKTIIEEYLASEYSKLYMLFERTIVAFMSTNYNGTFGEISVETWKEMFKEYNHQRK